VSLEIVFSTGLDVGAVDWARYTTPANPAPARITKTTSPRTKLFIGPISN